MAGLSWLRGIITRRPGRLVGTAAGVAVTVALLASIGAFLSATEAKMTHRALARVAVDWQVEVQPGASAAQVLQATRARPAVRTALPVDFAPASGFAATAGGSRQTTGPGRVLGLPRGYAAAFPGQLRTLAGAGTGVLLAQQTAANLHSAPGDRVAIGRPGLPPASIRVDGIVDLPQADSLFQRVGAPTGAQAQAPPDNVILLPAATFRAVEGPLAARRPDLLRHQVHARLRHDLPASPSVAFNRVDGEAHNLESRLAGAGLLGDNLGATLDKARSDALYAELLFLFLGLPGAVVAALLTATLAAAGSRRRAEEHALLRTRGATTGQLVRVAALEAAVAGIAGVGLGLGLALLVGTVAFGSASFGAGGVSAAAWAGGAALAGLLTAAGAIVAPAWRQARTLTVAAAYRAQRRPSRAPRWQRWGIDVICLVAAGVVFWQASANGYELVLAPEGVPQVSVNWYALLAPLLAWMGAGLLAYRLAVLVLRRGRGGLARALHPVGGPLSTTVVATMSRQRALLGRGIALVAVTVAFAGSTAVFDATYQQQAAVDARLTNGADVTIDEPATAKTAPAFAHRVAAVPGVASVEPLQHRYAYIGPDLQDLYGVRPTTIAAAGKLQDAWFAGGTASGLMAKLRRQPSAILVSEETVRDYQLSPGDTVRLRLVAGVPHRALPVAFHYAGVAKEFPTAPLDSFFVANAAYVAAATHDPAVGTFLVQTDGTDPARVAAGVRRVAGPTAKVTDITTQRKIVGSNLTAVGMAGLTKVELIFALVLVASATGLILALGFAERRRTFAIASALGARERDLGAFVWAESILVTVGGLVLGAAIAVGITTMLITILTGVFDPPPDAPAVPWAYLTGLVVLAVAAAAIGGAATLGRLRRPAISVLRDA
jgi:putative ABC transport system permease protein